jgi:hypothetical protein
MLDYENVVSHGQARRAEMMAEARNNALVEQALGAAPSLSKRIAALLSAVFAQRKPKTHTRSGRAVPAK